MAASSNKLPLTGYKRPKVAPHVVFAAGLYALCVHMPANAEARIVGNDAASLATSRKNIRQMADFTPWVVPINGTSPIAIKGDVGSPGGIFDPALALVGTSKPMLYMTYSSVVNASYISTRLAKVDGSGYTFLSQINLPTVGAMANCGASNCTGSIIHEVSTLAPLGDGLIALTHTYFVTAAGLDYVHGYISAYTSSRTSGPWTETKLLGWNAGAPFSTAGVLQNINSMSELAFCVLVSEPSLLRYNTTTYLLALMCPTPTNTTDLQENVILLSAQLTTTNTLGPFTFVSTLLLGTDMLKLGFKIADVSAPNIFLDQDSNLYVTVTPFAPIPATPSAYFGCLTFAVNSTAGFTIHRDGFGVPALISYIMPDVPFFSGACTIYPQSKHGKNFLLPVFYQSGATGMFSIFRTPFFANAASRFLTPLVSVIASLLVAVSIAVV